MKNSTELEPEKIIDCESGNEETPPALDRAVIGALAPVDGLHQFPDQYNPYSPA